MAEILQKDKFTTFGQLQMLAERVKSEMDALEAGLQASVEIYQHIRTDRTQSDADAIAAAVGSNTPNKGDFCIITTAIAADYNEYIAFVYNGTQWVAMDGNVDADHVILREDITMAGNYTQVGNLTKSQSGTATFNTSGKTVAEAFTEIFSKKLQPTITANPAVTVTLNQAGAHEVGTSLTPSYSASLSAGSYTYGPATGVTAAAWDVTNNTTSEKLNTASGSFNELVVGDSTNYTVTAQATHMAGTIAKDNLGGDSNPVVQISQGAKTKTSSAITGYRSYFYGVLSTKSTDADGALTSEKIRSLTNSNSPYNGTKTFTVNATGNARSIIVATPINSGRAGLKEVILTSAMNTPVTDSYKNIGTVSVEGKNGYTTMLYNVWEYAPAAIDAGEVHKITLA